MENGQMTLSREEAAELLHLKDVVSRGLETFVEVGNALLVIREKRLYRVEADTFDAFCHENWGFTQRRANQLIDAAKAVTETIEDSGSDYDNSIPFGKHVSQTENENGVSEAPMPVAPANARQASELGKVPAKDRASVWKEAVDSAPTSPNGQPKVTAAHVAGVVAGRQSKPAPAARDAESASKAEAKAAPEIPADEEGNHLPDRADVRAAFELRGEYRAIMQSFVGAKSKGLALAEKNPRINKQAFAAYCSNARSELKSAMPYAVCPYCRGEEGADCLACHGDGWVTEGMWVQAPEEMRRALRPRGEK